MATNHIAPNQTWIVDRFRPEDALGVTELFRAVYGDGYPIRKFIDPDLLIEENRANKTVSSVVRTSRGDIVGHNAIFHSAPSDRIFESGAGLVHRHYRGGKGIFTALGKHGIQLAVEEFQASAIWGEPVCNHIFAQKAIQSVGWKTFAVEVDLMPAAAYVQEESAAGRVSTLMMFDEFTPRQHPVFLPSVYEKWLRTLYTKLSAPRDVSVSTTAPRSGLSSNLEIQVFDFAQVVRIIVHKIGADFSAVFANKQADAVNQKTVVFQVWLPLSDPATGWAVDRLRQQGYFFGGLLPRWFNDDGLLVQKTLHPPAWETIRLADEWSLKILDMAKTDWERVQPR
ncbi:MAG: hypothetical protein ABIL58_24650 [Pseudomonadota bacterium]